MLSTACAKLAFWVLVYRMCSLFALPSETEHINMIADQFRMIPYDKLHGSPSETPRGIPRVQDSPRRWGAQKIAHNVVLSTARALSKPPRDCVYVLSYPVGCTLSLCGPWRLLPRWATRSLRGSPRGSLGECETHGLSPRISHKGFPGDMPQGMSHGIHQGSPRGSPRV